MAAPTIVAEGKWEGGDRCYRALVALSELARTLPLNPLCCEIGKVGDIPAKHGVVESGDRGHASVFEGYITVSPKDIGFVRGAGASIRLSKKEGSEGDHSAGKIKLLTCPAVEIQYWPAGQSQSFRSPRGLQVTHDPLKQYGLLEGCRRDSEREIQRKI